MREEKSLGHYAFPIIFILMLALAGYIYVFNPASSQPAAVALATKQSVDLGKDFVHPVYGYSLGLPYFLKGNYLAAEATSETDFYYRGEMDHPLFSIVHAVKNEEPNIDPAEKNYRPLGESSSDVFFLVTDKYASAFSEENQKNFGQVLDNLDDIADSFTVPTDLKDLAIKKFLNQHFAKPGTLTFAAYQTLGTAETASGTENYLQVAWQNYSWVNGDLNKGEVAERQLALTLKQNETGGYNVTSFHEPRSTLDMARIFPLSVRQDPTFVANRPEHTLLVTRLQAEIADQVIAYFGGYPTITKIGLIKKISNDNNLSVASVIFLTLVKKAESSSTPAQDKIVCQKDYFHCLIPGYIGQDTDHTLYRYVISPQATVAPFSSSTERSTISLSDFKQLFADGSTSTAPKLPYVINIENEIITRIQSFTNYSNSIKDN